jgi:hypothetical protein
MVGPGAGVGVIVSPKMARAPLITSRMETAMLSCVDCAATSCPAAVCTVVDSRDSLGFFPRAGLTPTAEPAAGPREVPHAATTVVSNTKGRRRNKVKSNLQ